MNETVALSSRLWALGVTVTLAGLVASVAFFGDEERYFPLSRYPMFAYGRPAREALPFVEVVLQDGTHTRLGAEWWTYGAAGVARNTLTRLTKAPPLEKKRFCEDLALKVAAADPPLGPNVDRLVVATGIFSTRKSMSGGSVQPDETHTIVACPIDPSRAPGPPR